MASVSADPAARTPDLAAVPREAYPQWVQQLGQTYLQGRAHAFFLHGPLHELVETPYPAPQHDLLEAPSLNYRFLPLQQYLDQELFAPRQHLLRYNRGEGFRFRDSATRQAVESALERYGLGSTALARIAARPAKAFAVLDSLLAEWLAAGASLALIVEAAPSLLPAGGVLDEEGRLVLQYLRRWAQQAEWRQADASLLLLSPDRASVHPSLLDTPGMRNLELGTPQAAAREAYIRLLAQEVGVALSDERLQPLIEPSAGLHFSQIRETLFPRLQRLAAPVSPDNQPTTAPESAAARQSSASASRSSTAQDPQLAEPEAWGDALQHTPRPPQQPEPLNQHQPDWVQGFGRLRAAQTAAVYVLHGNIYDKFPAQGSKLLPAYHSLGTYLKEHLLADYAAVLAYDRATGLSFRDSASKAALTQYLGELDRRTGGNFLTAFPREAPAAFELLDGFFRHSLAQGQGVALLLDHAETLTPASSVAAASAQDRAALIYLQKWARDPDLLRGGLAVVLITERLHSLQDRLVQTPQLAELELPYPKQADRLAFLQAALAEHPDLEELLEFDLETLAEWTAGLNCVHLSRLLAYALRNRLPLTAEVLAEQKRDLIEREAGGLLEFVRTHYTLDHVAGHAAAKQRLRQAAQALRQNRPDVLPMGYLIAGPVGTGKTFLVSAFAGEIGAPMVKLKNFRSQWVGETEANLEKILRLLRAMSPVAVMIDEADAALGNRSQSGDSGVGSRVFSTLASFMSDTANRGKILWFLMTARPDLMPVDLKRQGRAEEHLALFYPESPAEKRELLEVMLRKTGIRTVEAQAFTDDYLAEAPVRSGADLEAALIRAKFAAAAQGAQAVEPEHIRQALADFLPPTYAEEVELQTLLAVLECTSRELLPPRYRDLSRAELQQRVLELERLVG